MRRTTGLDVQVTLPLKPPRRQLPFWAASACWRLMSSFSFTKTFKSFPSGLHPIYSLPSSYSFLAPCTLTPCPFLQMSAAQARCCPYYPWRACLHRTTEPSMEPRAGVAFTHLHVSFVSLTVPARWPKLSTPGSPSEPWHHLWSSACSWDWVTVGVHCVLSFSQLHGVLEFAELEWSHQYNRVQILALHRTAQESHCDSIKLSKKMSVEL